MRHARNPESQFSPDESVRRISFAHMFHFLSPQPPPPALASLFLSLSECWKKDLYTHLWCRTSLPLFFRACRVPDDPQPPALWRCHIHRAIAQVSCSRYRKHHTSDTINIAPATHNHNHHRRHLFRRVICGTNANTQHTHTTWSCWWCLSACSRVSPAIPNSHTSAITISERASAAAAVWRKDVAALLCSAFCCCRTTSPQQRNMCAKQMTIIFTPSDETTILLHAPGARNTEPTCGTRARASARGGAAPRHHRRLRIPNAATQHIVLSSLYVARRRRYGDMVVQHMPPSCVVACFTYRNSPRFAPQNMCSRILLYILYTDIYRQTPTHDIQHTAQHPVLEHSTI